MDVGDVKIENINDIEPWTLKYLEVLMGSQKVI